MKKQLKRIYKFNRDAGNTTFRGLLEWRMVNSEYEELKAALNYDDKKEVLDACLDIIFVSCGSISKLGYDIKDVTMGIEQVDIEEDINIKTLDNAIIQYLELIEFGSKNFVPVLCKIICIAKAILYSCGLSEELIFKGLDRVADSNDSKYPLQKDKYGKIMKGENFKEPVLDDIVEMMKQTVYKVL